MADFDFESIPPSPPRVVNIPVFIRDYCPDEYTDPALLSISHPDAPWVAPQ